MTDRDANARSAGRCHVEILRLANVIDARLTRIEKLLQEIRENVAKGDKGFTASHRTSPWHGSGWHQQPRTLPHRLPA